MNILRKLSIGRRLTIMIILLVLLMSAGGFVSIASFYLSYRSSVFNLGIINDARKAQVIFKIQVQEWKNTLLRGYDQKMYGKYLQQFKERSREVQDILISLKVRLNRYPELSKRIDVLSASHSRLLEKYLPALEKYDPGDPLSPRKIDALVKGIDRAPTEEMDAFVDAAEKLALMNTRDFFVTSGALTGIGLIVILLFAVTASVFIVRSILVPLNEFKGTIETMTAGDFTVRLDVKGKDELAELGNIFNNFTETIAEIVKVVRDISFQLASMSDQMSATTSNFSENLQSQSASAEEITAAIEELASSMENINSGTEDQVNRLMSFSGRFRELSEQLDGLLGNVKTSLGTTEEMTDKAVGGRDSLTAMNANMD
ncbi:MAG TPA: methyl-accepting chemotaxis protein, partial [Spirochaetes bacterium]|nr:methyl-accepting chemotaxis protein [Spirochaetota bacterium]